MLMQVIIATIAYFMIGFVLFHFIEPHRSRANINYFILAYVVAFVFCIAYYLTWISLGLTEHQGVEGLFSPDSSTYYLDALSIAQSNFRSEVLDRVITDHLHEPIMAVQIYVFGEHVLIPKIYQVLLFSIAVVLWTSVARNILNDPRMVKRFYYLLLFCAPLLAYNATVLKEISLFLATTIAVYGYARYYYSRNKGFKFLWVALAGIILMFFFRRQFALVMFFALAGATLYGSGMKLKNKVFFSFAALALFFIASTLPIFQQIGATSPLTEGGSVFIARGEGHRVAAQMDGETAGMVGGARILLANPLMAFPMFVYGVFMMFFHPPFLYTPAEMIARGNLSYLTMGYYNAFFVLMLPAFYYGAKYLHKKLRKNPVLIALLIYFVLATLGTIFGSDSYRRFKISYFWPIAFLYISYGIATFPLWKKYLLRIGMIMAALFIMYFMADLIGWVSI